MYIFIDGAETDVCFCVVTKDKEASVPFFAHTPDRCSGQDKKGTRPLQPLVLFASEEVSVTTNLVCPPITYAALAA
jgi:hypothetical protein